MVEINSFGELIGIFVLLVVSLVLVSAFLFMLVITMCYFIGFAYDFIFGNSIQRVLHSNRICKTGIVNTGFYKRINEKTALREKYIRYETPLITFCLSPNCIIVLAGIIQLHNLVTTLIFSCFLYLAVYFVGMYRKYDGNRHKYAIVLRNNMESLKLSFIPITFLITVCGFVFTITGWKVGQDDLINIGNNLITLYEAGSSGDLQSLFLYLIKAILPYLLLMYVLSLPIQVTAYYIISVIYYFKEYGEAYRSLLKRYINEIRSWFKL